jgi:CRP/FNR family cyclic AMP-dependent transcriptional regulator
LHPIEVRLARLLLSALKRQAGTAASKVVPLDLGMSQSELALLIGASRPKVNIALSQLQEMGAITGTGPKLVCNSDLLEEIAETE